MRRIVMRSVAVCVCLCLRLSYSGSNFWNHWSRNFTLCLVKAGISSEYPAQYRTSMSPGQGQGHGSRKVKRTHSRVVCLRLKCNLLFLQISMAKITLNSIVKIFSHACQLAKQQVQTSSNARFAPAVSVCRWNSVNKTSSQVCENFGYDAWHRCPGHQRRCRNNWQMCWAMAAVCSTALCTSTRCGCQSCGTGSVVRTALLSI